MLERIKEHISFGLLLNLILPGAGHAYWREYLFGTFIFLVMLIASVLFFFSFLVELPAGIRAVLFGLPVVFYTFTFVDLWRAVRRREHKMPHGAAWAFLLAALVVFLLVPLSPGNFVLRNLPQIVRVDSGQLADSSEGSAFCLVDRSAYRVHLFFLDGPYPRRSPQRWDPVRYRDDNRTEQIGVVLGLPGEEVTFIKDSLFVDGFPVDPAESLSLEATEQVPLTRVDLDRILVATLKRGVIESTVEVSPQDVIGKVHRLF